MPPTPSVNEFVHSDPARMGGVPVFRGTRVPVKALFDYLEAGKTVQQFLDDFEGVPYEAVEAVLSSQ